MELVSLRFIVMMAASLSLALLVSFLRAGRERSAQRRQGKPLTSYGEMAADAVYGSLAAITLLLLQDTLKPLPIKTAVALAMVYGSIGPAVWDMAAGIVGGKYGLSLTKKGGQE